MAATSQWSTVTAAPWVTKAATILGLVLLIHAVFQEIAVMHSGSSRTGFFIAATTLISSSKAQMANSSVDLNWYPPNATVLNDLSGAINGTGVYGFVYKNSYPTDVPYGTYDWCNMPHVRKEEYVKAPDEYTLEYVELIHRHHKRTVYAANSFPVESYPWNCDDEGLFYYGSPIASNTSAAAYWRVYTSPINPFTPTGFLGTCQFPQITSAGLNDAYQHGIDLYSVYGTLLSFLSSLPSSSLSFRVTQNTITTQTAGMIIAGLFSSSPSSSPPNISVSVQASGIDSLEPGYACTAGEKLYDAIESSMAWTQHLNDASPIFATLDTISGVPIDDEDFHVSFDHYYDNLSARQCHAKPLPCQLVNGTNSTNCVTQDTADSVYRIGNWEYSYIYRDHPSSLAAGVATYGVWIAELAHNIRAFVNGASEVKYRHNVAHDGSVARLLSVLQVDVMVWPGMGSEVLFEVYSRSGTATKKYYMRVLFGGKVLRSSNPSLGLMDMVPLETVLAYFDGLVGRDASKVVGLCGNTS